MLPEGLITQTEKKTETTYAKQIVVASGSVLQNDWQNGQPLPCGYDRYSKMQFGNRDFFLNSLLWLTDQTGLVNLRQKTIPLRLLNTTLVNEKRNIYTVYAIVLPLLCLAITAMAVLTTRRFKYKH